MIENMTDKTFHRKGHTKKLPGMPNVGDFSHDAFMILRTSLVKTSATCSRRFCEMSGPATKWNNVAQDFTRELGHFKIAKLLSCERGLS